MAVMTCMLGSVCVGLPDMDDASNEQGCMYAAPYVLRVCDRFMRLPGAHAAQSTGWP